jgi:hypothetical protein
MEALSVKSTNNNEHVIKTRIYISFHDFQEKNDKYKSHIKSLYKELFTDDIFLIRKIIIKYKINKTSDYYYICNTMGYDNRIDKIYSDESKSLYFEDMKNLIVVMDDNTLSLSTSNKIDSMILDKIKNKRILGEKIYLICKLSKIKKIPIELTMAIINQSINQ